MYQELKIQQINHLHSTMVLLKLVISIVYSPNKLVSTFHYGSIKIAAHVLIVAPSGKSTFHYGSIKMLSTNK